MRFILGLLGGGLATLLLAIFFDFPAGLSPSNFSEAPLDPPATVVQHDEVVEQPQTVVKSVTVGLDDNLEGNNENAVAQVAMAPIEIETFREAPPEPYNLPQPAISAEVDAAPIVALQEEELRESDEGLRPDTLTAVAWKPFHSEVSASGFARRLSTQLGYPFHSIRKGPARYYVVFDYATEAQRLLLQQQVAAITGYAGQ